MQNSSLPVKNPPSPERVPPLLLAVTLAGIAVLAAACSGGRDSGRLVLSGNIEVTEANLGFKIPGRVIARPVSEGDRIRTGELVARMDDTEQKEQLALRRAELAGTRAVLAKLEAGSRPQEIVAAKAALQSAEAERHQARLDYARQKELRSKDAIADRELEAAQARLQVAEARVGEAGAHLKLVQEGPRAEDISQARAHVAQAQAAVALAETQVDNTRLVSPLTGVVLSHDIEPGEYVSPGTPVVTVADLQHVWVRAYVNETDLGRIRHGEKVGVRTDSFPGKVFHGIIGFIASEAEFTPKTVQTTKERVKLVFRIKVDVENQNDELKPGMPADVIIPETK